MWAGLARPVLFEYDPASPERFRRLESGVATIFETEGDVVVMMGEAILGRGPSPAASYAPTRLPTMSTRTSATIFSGPGLTAWTRLRA